MQTETIDLNPPANTHAPNKRASCVLAFGGPDTPLAQPRSIGPPLTMRMNRQGNEPDDDGAHHKDAHKCDRHRQSIGIQRIT